MVELRTWLDKSGVGKYHQLLSGQGIESVEDLAFLTKDEIVDLVCKIGMSIKSRKKFLGAIGRISSANRSNASTMLCPTHGNPIAFQCNTDNSLICSTCVTTTHQGHHSQSIGKAFDEEKGQIDNLITKAKRKSSEAAKGIVQVKTITAELDKSANLTKKAIHAFCESNRKAWTERERKLLHELATIVAHRKKALTQQANMLSSTSKRIGKIVRESEGVLSQQGESQVLLIGGVLRKRLNHISKKEVMLEPKASSDICFIPGPSLVPSITSAGRIRKTTTTSPEHTTAGGGGLAQARPGESSYFTIVAKDKHGRQRDSGGDSFNVQIAECNADMKIKDMKNGIYTVEYLLPANETRTTAHMSVRAGRKHIRGSPFTLAIAQECRGNSVRMWGSNGSGQGEFSSPTDVLVHKGSVYVTDYGNERIQVFGLDGTFIRMWGVPGSGKGQFSRPEGVAVHGDSVFVTDYGNHRIQVFHRNGTFQRMWGIQGTKPGEFNSPIGIAVSEKYVFITEYGNHRLQVFTLDGRFVRTWGSKGSGKGQFNLPYYVAVDGDNVYITDKGNNRIQVFRQDGTFLRMWGSCGNKKGEFSNPTGLVVDSKYVYVTEYSNHRIQVFRRNGTFVRMWGTRGMEKGQLSNPWGIGVSGATVYVAESSSNRIQVFR